MPKKKKHLIITKIRVMDLLKETYAEWSDDDAPVLSAALSYYFMFSLAPLMIIVIAVAGFVLKEGVVRAEILRRLTEYLDYDNAVYILSITHSYLEPQAGILATIIAIIIMLVGSTSVFVMLKQALNKIWKVKEYKEASFRIILRERLNYLLIALGLGVWIAFSILLSPIMALFGKDLQGFIAVSDTLLDIVHFLVSIVFLSLLFAMIFKFLPDRRILWSDVWAGSIASAIFFTLGRYLLGFYLAKSMVSSAYGAAGSLVAILLWVYYSSLIFLFGAELTQVFARKYGSRTGL
jgi:membrane protein